MGKAAITRATTAKPKTAASASPPAPSSFIPMTNHKKKKGRPSLADLQKRQLKSLTPSPSPKSNDSIPSRRSSRRRSSGNYNSLSSEFISDDYDDDDDERKEKKVKLVVRLPQSTQLHSQNSSSQNSGSNSDSEPEEAEDHDASLEGPTVNVVDSRSSDAVMDQGEQDMKVTDTLHGSPLGCGPTTPLPDKKFLVFILDRLQKKDTYGVFAEPVDPDELPDYFEIVEHPMDFGTVRKKLDGGAYSTLEELEADVFLICSNAMQYNAPDTVYHRQARSIHELAKRDFANLRHEGDDGEPKVVRRGRPPNKNVKKPIENSPADRPEYKNVKKPVESSPIDRAGNQHSSGATLATGEDKSIGSNAYNLRKGATMYKFRSNDGFTTNYGSRNGESYSDWLVDWNSEFPAKILRQDMKYGKKHFSVDENKRDTYRQSQLLAASYDQPYQSNAGDRKQLIAVGLHLEPHGYARSLARYAASLGSVPWKVASMKIKSVLSDGTPFGPGWVGENDAPSQSSAFAGEKQKSMNGFIHHHDSGKPLTPVPGLSSTSAHEPPDEMAEAVKRLNSHNQLAEPDDISWRTPGSSIQAQQKSLFQNNRNGFNNIFNHDLPSQTGLSRRASSSMEEGSTSHQTPGLLPKSEMSPSHYGGLFAQAPVPPVEPSVEIATRLSQQGPLSVPPDLNVRVQTSGSPSSSLKIGSPQQPDLALQL